MRVFMALSWLGNTERGLSQSALRQLYQSCITTVADFRAELWWNQQKTQCRPFQRLQNQAMRKIAGSFKTTPIATLEADIRKKSFPLSFSPFLRMGRLRSWRLERPVAVYCVHQAPFLLTLATLHPKPSPTAIHLQSVSPSPQMYSPHLGAIHLSALCPVVHYNMCFPPNSRCFVSLSLYVRHPVFSSYCTLRVIFAPSELFMVLLEIYFAFFFF